MANKICYLIIGNPPDANLLNETINETELGYESVKALATATLPDRLANDTTFLPDYIFIDWDIDMLRRIKAIQRLKNSKVIVYEKEMSTDDINEAKQNGAAYCLLKATDDTGLKELLLQLFTSDNVPFVLAYPVA